MEILQILKDDHPTLRKKSVEADPLKEAHRTLSEYMLHTMRESNGIGLAAPQVGHNLRIIVVECGTAHKTLRIMFNPEIVKSEKSVKDLEGCLSFPGLEVTVKRKKRITVKYKNIQGEVITEEFKNLPARVIQHEIDHLEGVLLPDYK